MTVYAQPVRSSVHWLGSVCGFGSALLVGAAMVALTACAGTQTPGPTGPGDAFAPPSMEALPDHDPGRFTEKMEFAWLLTEQSFQLAPPHPPPAGGSHREVEQWSESELRRWLEQKNALVEAARSELNVAAEENHRQRVWAGALVGLMYEDLARILLNVPVPRELANEPDIATIYREIVQSQATPYLDHANRAYRACHLNGRRRAGLRTWSGFCEDRRANLPAQNAEPGDGGTTVEVIRE